MKAVNFVDAHMLNQAKKRDAAARLRAAAKHAATLKE
jgi:hypothetical protein